MSAIVHEAKQLLPQIRAAFQFQPQIIPYLDHLEIDVLPAVMAAVIEAGHNERDFLQDELDCLNCPFSRELVDAFLDQFDGPPTEDHLWQRSAAGVYKVHPVEEGD